MDYELYTFLKKHIEKELPQIKNVRLFNNQFNREPVENAVLYPLVYIQIVPQEFRELGCAVQQCDYIVTTHLGFESYKDEDTFVLKLKQDLFKVVNRFQNEKFSKLLRIAERPNFDHDNVQLYETDYKTTGKDYKDDNRPTIPVNATASITGSIVTNI